MSLYTRLIYTLYRLLEQIAEGDVKSITAKDPHRECTASLDDLIKYLWHDLDHCVKQDMSVVKDVWHRCYVKCFLSWWKTNEPVLKTFEELNGRKTEVERLYELLVNKPKTDQDSSFEEMATHVSSLPSEPHLAVSQLDWSCPDEGSTVNGAAILHRPRLSAEIMKFKGARSNKLLADKMTQSLIVAASHEVAEYGDPCPLMKLAKPFNGSIARLSSILSNYSSHEHPNEVKPDRAAIVENERFTGYSSSLLMPLQQPLSADDSVTYLTCYDPKADAFQVLSLEHASTEPNNVSNLARQFDSAFVDVQTLLPESSDSQDLARSDLAIQNLAHHLDAMSTITFDVLRLVETLDSRDNGKGGRSSRKRRGSSLVSSRVAPSNDERSGP